MNSKYSTFLTVLLVIIIIAILGVIGFLGFRYISSANSKKEAENFVDTFPKQEDTAPTEEEPVIDDNLDVDVTEPENTGDTTDNNQQAPAQEQRFNGYLVAGTIEIPATGLSCPVLAEEEYSKSALETSVVVLHGVGLNQPGNTTIAGHNYRNGNFFSNNKKLNIGDKIYITDLTGKRLSYTIYNKYETSDTDADYMTRDTQGATEISLTTCTDDSKARLIIWAKADI